MTVLWVYTNLEWNNTAKAAKVSRALQCNIGALLIRIGFGGIITNPQNSIGKYCLGPYVSGGFGSLQGEVYQLTYQNHLFSRAPIP